MQALVFTISCTLFAFLPGLLLTLYGIKIITNRKFYRGLLKPNTKKTNATQQYIAGIVYIAMGLFVIAVPPVLLFAHAR